MPAPNQEPNAVDSPRPTCFVICPLSENHIKNSDEVLKHLIKPVLKNFKIDVQRSDQIPHVGDIGKLIVERVINSDLVIADLTERNPNVFYELAVRHATHRPCIQIARRSERGEPELPFDVRSINTVFYDFRTPDACEESRSELKSLVKSVMDSGYKWTGLLSSFPPLGTSRGPGREELETKIDLIQRTLEGLLNPANRQDHALFKARTQAHHNLVHLARDLYIRLVPPSNGMFVRSTKDGTTPSLHPLDLFRPEIETMLAYLVDVFKLTVDRDINIWASLRDRRADNRYHTFARMGAFSPSRAEHSHPLHKDTSTTIQKLKLSVANMRCVIITGPDAGPEAWERQPNDALGEDGSVLMGAVMSKYVLAEPDGQSKVTGNKLMWVLSLAAHTPKAFGEHHVPLMQCCIDTFSLVLNAMLRSPLNDANAA